MLSNFMSFRVLVSLYAFAILGTLDQHSRALALRLTGGNVEIALAPRIRRVWTESEHDFENTGFALSKTKSQSHNLGPESEKTVHVECKKIPGELTPSSFQTPAKQSSSCNLRLTPRALQRDREANASPSKIEVASPVTESETTSSPQLRPDHLKYVASTPPLKTDLLPPKRATVFGTKDSKLKPSRYFRTPVPSKQQDHCGAKKQKECVNGNALNDDESAADDLIRLSLHQKRQLDNIMKIAEKQPFVRRNLDSAKPVRRILLADGPPAHKVTFQKPVPLAGIAKHSYKSPIANRVRFADSDGLEHEDEAGKTSESQDASETEIQNSLGNEEVSGVGDLVSYIDTPKESEVESIFDTQLCDTDISLAEEVSQLPTPASDASKSNEHSALKAREEELISSLQVSADKLRAALSDIDSPQRMPNRMNPTLFAQSSDSNNVSSQPHSSDAAMLRLTVTAVPSSQPPLQASKPWLFEHVARNLNTLLPTCGLLISIPTVLAVCVEAIPMTTPFKAVLFAVWVCLNIGAAASMAYFFKLRNSRSSLQ